MKNIIITLVVILFSVSVFSQQTKKDSLLRAISNYRETVFKNAEVFLNKSLSADERIKAIIAHAVIYDEKQKDRFVSTVLSDNETAEIRAMALNKVYREADNNENFSAQILEWFANPRTPKILRDETLNLVGNLSFSSMPGILSVYPKMVEDPDIKFRTFAISKLVINGDARAQQLLIRGIENPQSQLLDPVTAMGILSFSPKKDYYPAVYKLMLETKDDQSRLAAVQILGGYKEATNELQKIVQSATEKNEFRKAALLALYSGDKTKATNLLPGLLADKSASAELQILAIQIATDTRKNMAYRKKIKRADRLDMQISEILQGKGLNKEKDLLQVANRYMLLVRPPL
jgi:hypothetical protein